MNIKITAEDFQRAIEFAARSHRGQVRKGDGRPYILHPISVMNRLFAVKDSSNMFLLGTACILHDVVEDCNIKLDEIAKEFGYAVASLVQELTLEKEKYETIGKKEYLAQEMVGMSSYALCIKLCDRLDNVCDMKSMKPDFIKRYVEETHFILNEVMAKRDRLTATHRTLITYIRAELINK